jgi:SAM-dependent methyltransferase
MSGTDYEGRDLEALADMVNYYAWIMDAFAPHVIGKVVEYGAGSGNVSEKLLPRAKHLTLVEPSSLLIDALRARFAASATVEVVRATLERHIAGAGDASFDAAILVNVLEHIEDDRNALANLFRILRPGGHLLVFVPAMQWLMSKLDRLHGHFRRYYKADLKAKVTAAGGEVMHCRYFDMIGVAPWLVLNRAFGITTFNRPMISFHDKFVVPVSRAIETVVAPPFGKNLILVAKKR